MKEKGYKLLVTLVVVTAIVGAFWGGVVFHSSGGNAFGQVKIFPDLIRAQAPNGVDFSVLWKTWELLNDNYIDVKATSTTADQVSDEDRVFGAAQGLVDSLGDPYTVFLNPEENQSFKEEISGKFGGIGIEIGYRDEVLTVVAPLPNTPAAKAGIRSGDKIVEINKESALKLSIERAVSLIRGEPGSTVELKILRAGENKAKDFKIARAIIQVPNLDHRSLGGGVYYIKLHSFGPSTSKLFRQAYNELIKSGDKRLILDLRGNPGGYLDTAVEVASWFLPAGKVVVIEDRGAGQQTVYRSESGNVIDPQLRMVVLVDKGSASASEIVAGALRENGVAILVGEKTFGKGSVQELIPVTSETALKVTVARWLTPNGISISSNGLEPDVEVVAATAEELSVDPEADPQLKESVKLVKKMK